MPEQQFNKPFTATSPDDHRASVWVVTLLCMTFVVLGVFTRVYVRFKAFGLDDNIMLGAFIVALAEFCTVIAGLLTGLGKSTNDLSSSTAVTAGQIFLASEAIFIAALYVTKHSVLCTIERLLGPDYKRQRLGCRIFHGLLVLCAIASLLLVTVECPGGSLLTKDRSDVCKYQVPRWAAVAAIDGVTEIAVFAGFCVLISSLQLQKRMKITVTILLAFRLGCIAFASVHAKYINAYVSNSTTTSTSANVTSTRTNAGLAVVGPLVWQQLNLGYSLLSALLIALKSFLSSFDVGHGWGENQTFKQSSLSQSGNRGRGSPAFGLKPLSKSAKGASGLRSWVSRNDDQDEEVGRGKGEKRGYKANVEARNQTAPDNGSVGSGRSGISQHPMIMYEKRYEVTHEAR